MKPNNLIATIVGLTVAIIVLSTALMPTISDVTKTEKTFTNEGYFRASETSDETVIVWDTVNSPGQITVNDEVYDLSSMGFTDNKSYSLCFADDFVLRYFPVGGNSNMQIWKTSYVTGTSQSAGIILTCTITSEGITVEKDDDGSVTSSTVAHSGSYFRIDSDGDYIMKNMNEDAYVHKTSTIFYGCGISDVYTSIPSTLYLEGAVDDYTVTPLKSGVTVSNESSTYSEVEGYIDLFSLEKLTFTTSYTSEGVTETIDQTYSYFLVPYEVTAELSQHMSSAEISLIGITAMILVLGILIAATHMIIRRD